MNSTSLSLKVQQLVEKGWCNENTSTNNLKYHEIFTKSLPENLKDFANKRQVENTSFVLESSIPFHTLVKLVDAEDIAKDKIRSHDLTLEIISFTNQLQLQNLETQQSEHLVFTQPRDPNNKHKSAKKKIVHTVIEQTTPSPLVSKNNDMTRIKETHLLDLNPLKNHLHNTFVHLLVQIQHK